MSFINKINFRGVIGKGPVALAHINLIIAISAAMVTTVWALYINSFVESASTTGFLSGFLSLIAFISYFIIVPKLSKYDKRVLFSASLLIFVLFYMVLYFLNDIYHVIFLASLITVLHTIRISSFGVILKNNSSNKELTQKEGLNWTFVNLGWVLGPLVAGYLAVKLGIRPIFIISALFSLLALLVFHFTKFRKEKYSLEPNLNPISNYKQLLADRKRLLAYILTGGSAMWWMIVYVFMPLYISSQGLPTTITGYFLVGVALPLIFLESFFSKLTDKIGFKKIFFIGFLIPAICVLVAFFMNDIYMQLGLLILASIGLAMLEPTTESYFLKTIKKEEAAKFFGPYVTSRDLGQILSKALPALIILVLPFKFIFLAFFAFMAIMALISLKVRD